MVEASARCIPVAAEVAAEVAFRLVVLLQGVEVAALGLLWLPAAAVVTRAAKALATKKKEAMIWWRVVLRLHGLVSKTAVVQVVFRFCLLSVLQSPFCICCAWPRATFAKLCRGNSG